MGGPCPLPWRLGAGAQGRLGLVLSQSPSPRLRCQSLLKESWQQLCSVLSAHASLQRLDLAGIVLSEWALKRLCEELQKPTCSIRQLM